MKNHQKSTSKLLALLFPSLLTCSFLKLYKNPKQMLTITLILLSIACIVNGGKIRPTRLLPNDGSTVHCAGQVNQNLTDDGQMDGSINSFNNYSDYLSAGTKPLAMMVYFGLTLDVPTINSYFQNLTDIMKKYPANTWYGIQMGMYIALIFCVHNN